MKILIYSPAFYPSIGGLEMVVSILAHEFVRLGHDVKLVSQTPDPDGKPFPFEVVRKPNPQRLLELTRWCEIYFQNNVSLKGIWPLLILRKSYSVAHHGWYGGLGGRVGWRGQLKFFVTRFASNISVSHAVADHVPTPSTVIPNPYREEFFHRMPQITRDKELIFLGRLVSDKGADLLLSALAQLKKQGLIPRLMIVGGGPEDSRLRLQAKEMGIVDQVDFVGIKVGEELAQVLNAHQILVIPSRWQEPFGIVALEGIACGCVVVGSEKGGLKDAIGPCGVTFPNGDVGALTHTLSDLLSNSDKLAVYRTNAEAHLSQHRREEVAKAYLQVFEQAIAS